MWTILALGAALLTSFNPILYKRILKDVDSLIVVWAVTLLGLPLLGVFTLWLTLSMPRLDWIFLFAVIGSAGLNAAAHLASTEALKLEDVSLVIPLLTFSPVFTLLVAIIFLDETPSTRGLIGVGLVLVGAYWLNQSRGTSWLNSIRSLALKPGILLILFAGLLWAITPVLEKIAIQHSYPENPRLVAFMVETILAVLLTFPVLRHDRAFLGNLRLHRRDLLMAGLIAGSAPILGYTAISLGPVGYVTTLFKFSSVITVLWSALFLKEHDWRKRLPASSLMVVGAIFLIA
jgi:uncharacterized membrane protein